MVQAADGSLIRFRRDDVVQKRESSKSIMPERLLVDANDQSVADLIAYLNEKR
jgi:hypothetical protein